MKKSYLFLIGVLAVTILLAGCVTIEDSGVYKMTFKVDKWSTNYTGYEVKFDLDGDYAGMLEYEGDEFTKEVTEGEHKIELTIYKDDGSVYNQGSLQCNINSNVTLLFILNNDGSWDFHEKDDKCK